MQQLDFSNSLHSLLWGKILIPTHGSDPMLSSLLYQGGLADFWLTAQKAGIELDLIYLLIATAVLGAGIAIYLLSPARPVYLIGYHVYKAPDRLKMNTARFMSLSRQSKLFTESSMEFQRKVLERGGLGNDTYLPQAVQQVPATPSMAAAREEAEMVMFDSVQKVLDKYQVAPRQVDILIVNCSLFGPTPSLSAMIVNHFKMRSNVIAYNLGGMGCSAGLISIALAREMLQVYPNSNVLVVSTENMSQNWYNGNQKSMLIPNCLFRVGGAAMLLSNKRSDRRRAQYCLQTVVRTHLGANDESYNCVIQEEDEQGKRGVHLSKDLMEIAGKALRINITTLGPQVLPLTEKARYAINMFRRKVLKARVKAYTPDFSKAFDHICIHTGGRGVIDEIEKQLKFSNDMVAPSRQTLFRYGNISSSSIWYVLACIEATGAVRAVAGHQPLECGSGTLQQSSEGVTSA
ncbi:hypothetical protein WJX73_006792 [Symbiochloris irregularis]|uniref:3-ketoacyl-CoA synthase n=1 Tax=Symbiochloris irregularis TaxID=706552 RepID=A0AAW1PYB6_9CHLO